MDYLDKHYHRAPIIPLSHSNICKDKYFRSISECQHCHWQQKKKMVAWYEYKLLIIAKDYMICFIDFNKKEDFYHLLLSWYMIQDIVLFKLVMVLSNPCVKLWHASNKNLLSLPKYFTHRLSSLLQGIFFIRWYIKILSEQILNVQYSF